GSQDTCQRCWLPGAWRAVCAVWSLVIVVSLMVRVMVRLPGLVRVGGCGRAWFPGARRGRVAGRAASRGAGRPRSRTGGGPVASGRGSAGRRGRSSRACPCRPAADPGRGDGRLGGAVRVRGVSCRDRSLAGLLVGGEPGLTGRLGVAVVSGWAGFVGLEHAVGYLVEGFGV